MEFSYDAYRLLIKLLREERYEITDYYAYQEFKGKCVVFRHDTDDSVKKHFNL